MGHVINVNLVKRMLHFVAVTCSLVNYGHEFVSMLELAIPTIDKFTGKNA